MHAAPGVIEPALFDFTLEEILQTKRPCYIAKVLEKYFECYLEIIKKDTDTLFIKLYHSERYQRTDARTN